LFIRLFKLNKDQKWFYVAGTIGAVCAGMVYPCIAIVFGYALADFQIPPGPALKSKMRENAWVSRFPDTFEQGKRWLSSTWFFIIAILAGIAILFQAFNYSRAGVSLNSKLRIKAFDSVLRHDIEWFDEEKNSTGAVTANLAEDPQKVQGLFGPTMGTIIQSCTTLIGGCIIGLCYGPRMSRMCWSWWLQTDV
jgi:ATP-binding cassette subfamily B (MDR/TAP) protein 1